MSKSPAAILYDSTGTHAVGVVLDGAVYRLQMAGKVARASDGAYINPATQETLVAIKDTDGIKKIVDQLPAGTNEIGKVAQGTKAVGADAWPAALYDSGGNEQLGPKVKDESIPVTMASNQGPIAITFTAPEARTGVSHATMEVGSPTAGTLIPLRATTYTEPSSEAQRSFVSDDSNDTAAGTGARTVEFTYFDNTGDGPFTGEVTLAGTTPVDTTETDIRFIEKMRVLTVGSSGTNEGTISMYSATAGGGTVIGSIGVGSVISGVGDSETLWAHHYVPTGWTVQLAVLTVALQSGGVGTTGLYLIKSTRPLVADSAEFIEGGYLLLPGSFQRSYQFTGTVEGFARLLCYAIPGVNNTTMNAAFDWSEVPTP